MAAAVQKGFAWPFLTQTSVETASLLLQGSISGIVGSFQAARVFTGWRALTIESLLMSECEKGHEPLSSVNYQQKWKYGSSNTELSGYQVT